LILVLLFCETQTKEVRTSATTEILNFKPFIVVRVC
jgi:hypothetical protein